jgi:hypothetical protein
MTRLSHERWLAAQQTASVRARILAKATRLGRKARANAAAAGVDTTITVSQGTRPGGRPYARVTSSNAAAEHGTSWTERSRILGRATYENGPED